MAPGGRPAIVAALAVLALAAGCGDSPTAPRPLGAGVIAPGSLVRGTIQSTADTAHFSLVLTGGSGAMVYLMAKGDWLRLEVRDSTGKLVATTNDMFNTTRPERSPTGIIPASPFRYRVDVSMVNGTAPSDFEIRVVAASNAPEHVPPTLAVGTIVSGEDLDHAFDIDSFAVSVDHDELVTLYLRKLAHSASVVTARIYAPGDYPGGTSAGEADTVLGAVGSGRVRFAAGVSYVIRVYYDTPDTARTPYEMQLRRVDPAPESAPSALVPGDTVRESIDYLGDFDEFTLSGVPGTRYNLFADAGGVAPHGITAQLSAVDASEPSVSAVAGGAPLAENATGIFTIPPSGTVNVRVTDGAGYERGHVGPYRLLVYPIDSSTEGATADLGLGRAASGRIDMLGDVDAFRLTTGSDTAVNIVVRRPEDGARRPLAFTLRDASGTMIARQVLGVLPTPGDTAGLGTRVLRAGSYTLTVEPSSSTVGGFTGAYEIFPHAIDRAPEDRPRTIAVGDTIRGESLDVAGDIDQFAVSLNAGDSVYVYLSPATPDVHAGAGIRRAADGTYFGTDAFNYAAGGYTQQSRVFVAPTTGTYYVEVGGETAGIDQHETGGYTVALPRITTAPEDRQAAFALGDTVTGLIDVVGDADDYVLTAAAGTEVTGGVRTNGGFTCCVETSFIDPATGAVLGRAINGFEGFGRVVVPASGALRVRVSEQPGCGGYGCYGPEFRRGYTFWVIPVNRAPETRASTFAIGDTVSGEAIDPVGDVDEFTFGAAAGDTVNLYFQTPMGTWGYQGLTMTLLDQTTGATLGTLTSNNPTTNLEDIALQRVVLPSSGSYMIRVVGTSSMDNKGAYRFRVAR